MLEITDISSRVDTGSPRIHGLGTDARVFDMSCDTKLAHAPGPRPSKNIDLVSKLELTIKTLETRRDVHRSEYDMLNDAVKSFASGTPAQMDMLMNTYVQRKQTAMKIVMECEVALTSLRKELWLLNSATQGETAGRVNATILAKRACQVTFELTYRTLTALCAMSSVY